MRAVRFEAPDGGTRIGVLEDSEVRDAGAAGAQGFVPTQEAWQELAGASGPTYPVDSVRLLAPVMPGKILAIALNYRDHAAEAKREVPSMPAMFAKFPSSVIGPGDSIVIPREENRPDWEGEVAFVIGRPAYRVTLENAWEHVGGMTALNDVSGRRAQLETPLQQFTLGKSFDTFTPLGPCIASPDGIDPDNVGLRTTVSGEVMQESNTKHFIFSLPVLLEYLTRGVTLQPGDIIATGTPGGVGNRMDPPRFLREGDVVDVWVEGVGTLTNPVLAES
jgi:2-keto-4-pentenoate hydratase/2-oxohepta-3-ene-1,7-dioic acid hydratase in catechol pathway